MTGLGVLVLAAWGCAKADSERSEEKDESMPGEADDPQTAVGSDEPADSDEYDAGPSASMCPADLMATSSGATHTHRIVIPGADISAGGTRKYETSSDFAHTHWVELTDDDFATLRGGGTVIKTSCSGGDHSYELRCADHVMASGLPEGCNDECGGTAENACD